MTLNRYYCPKCRLFMATDYETFIANIPVHVATRPACEKFILAEQAKWEKEETKKKPVVEPPPCAKPAADDLVKRVVRGMQKPKTEGV